MPYSPLTRATRRLGPLFLAVTALLAPRSESTAAPVNSKQAAAAVTGWLSLDQTPLGEALGGSVQRVDTFRDKAGTPLYYIVHLDPAGYVVVAADDLVEPIIGFSAAGAFDSSEANPLAALVQKDLSGRIAYAQKAASKSLDSTALRAQAKWQRLESGSALAKGLISISEVRVPPLTQMQWNQSGIGSYAVYNYYTPPYGDGNSANYPAGCVATAMAQLMRYYQYPTTSVGMAGFSITYDGNGLTYNLHGGNGSGSPYVWSDMPLVPSSTPTTTQCQAIGALVADAGATVNMAYTSTGSSSSLLDGAGALVSTFHFTKAVKGWNSNNDLGSALFQMMNPNLDAGCPVMLGIQGTGGHAVVADGYGYNSATLYHHLNLGWGGSQTAWYALPYIDASPYTFTVVDNCVYNVYTNGTGEIISGRVLDQIGRPVTNATVTATRTGGGVYTATTSTNGIYALATIPSNSSYALSVTKANFTTVNGNFSTGASSDWSATSGNYWGADFTMPMLTTVLDHLAWGTVAPTQYLNAPFPVTLTAQNLTNGVATGFTGPVALSAYMTGIGSASSTIIGSLSPNMYRYSSSGLTHGYAFTPNTNIQVSAVRAYSGDKVSIWTDSGTLLANQAVSASSSWVETTLATPIELRAGTIYRVTCHFGAGVYAYYKTTSWPTSFPNGSVGQNFYTAYGDAFPGQVYATGQGPMIDLRYKVAFSNSIPVSPTSSGAFVNGVWNGNISVGQVATNVVVKADDGAGHIALSSPFNVVIGIRLLSPQRPPGGPFQCTVSSAPGLKLEMLASTNLSSWNTVTNLTNTTGTIIFTDSATSPVRRFYRAHQLP